MGGSRDDAWLVASSCWWCSAHAKYSVHAELPA